jgi:hypothetical protein
MLFFILSLGVLLVVTLHRYKQSMQGTPAQLVKSYSHANKRIDLIQLEEGRCLVLLGIGEGGIDCEWNSR